VILTPEEFEEFKTEFGQVPSSSIILMWSSAFYRESS